MSKVFKPLSPAARKDLKSYIDTAMQYDASTIQVSKEGMVLAKEMPLAEGHKPARITIGTVAQIRAHAKMGGWQPAW